MHNQIGKSAEAKGPRYNGGDLKALRAGSQQVTHPQLVTQQGTAAELYNPGTTSHPAPRPPPRPLTRPYPRSRGSPPPLGGDGVARLHALRRRLWPPKCRCAAARRSNRGSCGLWLAGTTIDDSCTATAPANKRSTSRTSVKICDVQPPSGRGTGGVLSFHSLDMK
eukprot:7391996-Prymnesium_polylepis.2